MKVIRFDDAERYEPEPNWKRVSLCSEPDISIEHFFKPPHHASPRHEHPNAQVLFVLRGEIWIKTDEDGEQRVEEGDAAYIPGGQAHVVENRLSETTVGLDIFVPGRDFKYWLKMKGK